MAFGDNGKRKKTLFEKVTLVVVLIMLFVTLAGIFATALGAFSRFWVLPSLFKVRRKYEYVFRYSQD